MDLFEYMHQKKSAEFAPLALRMRPKTLDDFIGQEHILSKGSLLHAVVKNDKLINLILFGPPGSGKTSLAKIISNNTQSVFIKLNATNAGTKDIKDIISNAKTNLYSSNKRTILFIDEIHRFNRLQQDVLLPHIEQGDIIFIGATTENPYFEVNKALISRSTVFELQSLSSKNIKDLITKAVVAESYYLSKNIILTEDSLSFIAINANGDARSALNMLEQAILIADDKSKDILIDSTCIQNIKHNKKILYDKTSDEHYNTISAFIKSMRGSDPDAALYYLAKMLKAGEDPKFIARRIMILASEDIGNADPNAINIANSVFNAVMYIGLPECQLSLAHATIYMSIAPKSNSIYTALAKAIQQVNKESHPTPSHLCDSHYKGAQDLNKGTNYKYPHDYVDNYVDQSYLPKELKGTIYYLPSENGMEAKIKLKLKKLRKEN
jgi:putative ATPase